jgi:hypothetical protein
MGGSPFAPAFTFVFVTREHANDADIMTGADFLKAAPASAPVYQINGNMTFPPIDGTFQVKSAAGVDLTDVVCAVIDGDDVTVFIDTSKITRGVLKSLAAGGDEMLTGTDDIDLSKFGVLVGALLPEDADAEKAGSGWNMTLFAVKKVGDYPARIDPDPEKVKGTLKISGGPLDVGTVIKITNVTGWKGHPSAVDGSLFSWAGGEAATFTFENDNDEDNKVGITATAPEIPEWVINQTPATIKGAGKSGAKFSIGGNEGWLGYVDGIENEVDWETDLTADD